MSFQIGSYALTKHAFFFQDGWNITVPSPNTGSVAGASSRSNKPDPTDPLYIDLGSIDDWSDEIKTNGDEKTYRGVPGRRVLYDIHEKGADGMSKFTTQELNAYAIQIMWRTTQALTSAGGQFNPNSTPAVRGWLHVELYGEDNSLAYSMDQYGMLRIVGGFETKEGGLIKPQWEQNHFFSTLNTALLNNS